MTLMDYLKAWAIGCGLTEFPVKVCYWYEHQDRWHDFDFRYSGPMASAELAEQEYRAIVGASSFGDDNAHLMWRVSYENGTDCIFGTPCWGYGSTTRTYIEYVEATRDEAAYVAKIEAVASLYFLFGA